MLHSLKTILLVEDDEGAAYDAARTLTAAGYTVTIAPDYREALRVLESTDIVHLLLTDIRLPGIHGFALGRMARNRRRALKILYVTAFPDLPQHEIDTALGKILYKPIAPDALVAEVKAALDNG
ncbi:MAG TPA: response regulator [Stellaceae bacterium]|jgi:DNA-binding response OmpR family regulator